MNCENCGNKIVGQNISAAQKDFCSDICHLKFWKEEMPNLGGRWIEEEDIQKLKKLSGKEREEKYNEIINFIMDNFGLTSFMLNLQYKKKIDKEKEI